MQENWKIFMTMKSSWEAMYLDCVDAKKSISLEQYIFENDEIGQKFLELFVKKAREGLKVRVVCDSFGSGAWHGSKLVEELERAGGIFRFYQPLKWSRWFPRTHIKTLIIDEKIIYTGGVCIAKRMENWRDTHLRFIQSENFRYVCNRPIHSFNKIYRELISKIRNAKKYIYISSAFFIPNKGFLRALESAARHGIDVRVITTKHSDHYFADWVALSYLGKLVKNQVRVFHYEKTVFHCKTVVIDDEWATIGSTNMDILSFFYNREANVMISDKKAITELKEQFFEDLKFTTELTTKNYRGIPLWKRAIGFMARFLKIFLREK